jgi:hypothetical protein
MCTAKSNLGKISANYAIKPHRMPYVFCIQNIKIFFSFVNTFNAPYSKGDVTRNRVTIKFENENMESRNHIKNGAYSEKPYE